MSHKACVAYVVHDDYHFLAASIKSFHCGIPIFVFLSEVSWIGDQGDYEESERIAKSLGVNVISGHWPSEQIHRNAAYDWLRENGFGCVIACDSDELIEPQLLDALLRVGQQNIADRVHVEWNTYWRSPEYVIRPREPFRPLMMFNLHAAKYESVRNFSGGRPLILSEEHGIVHHLSYAGPDCRIKRKITSWGHRNEIVPGWYDRVWMGWPQDKTMRDLHPTHPQNYGFAERIHVPEIVRANLYDGHTLPYTKVAKKSANRRTKGAPLPVSIDEAPVSSPGRLRDPSVLARSETAPRQETGLNPPSISVVIPVFGGEDDTARCLRSLEVLPDLVLETIVIDNGSRDKVAEIAEGFSGVHVVRLGENKGFAAACNEGIKRAKGSTVLLLNNDTVVTRAGLTELLASLSSSGAVAAVGPYTNQAGHGQQTAVTYTSPDTLGLFAEDFAARDVDDRDVDMLVGFCMLIKKQVLDEIGPLDEEFGFGTFEDNDLCYRMRRAGYRLVLSGKSFIHHEGSKTLQRMNFDVAQLMEKNHRFFVGKWKADLETGFVNTLSGLGEALAFKPENSPERRLKEIKRRAKRADISLCMIARDEERVIGACLDSIAPFVREIIVVDTGSVDRTREIARAKGATVIDFAWTDSFSEARNESLRHARGKWILWMDADDTADMQSGLTILEDAINAPPQIAGFAVPVRFVDDGPAGGVQVDHVKLFRNKPGIAFKFHIHEQIVHCFKGRGEEIARSQAFVLHSGYDTSPEGQAKKRLRDEALLALDMEEFPDHPFVHFNCGMTAHYTGEHEKAIQFLTRSIELAEPGESHLRKAYALLAGSLVRLGRDEEGFAKMQEGLKLIPGDAELSFLSAQMLFKWGKLDEARASYDDVLKADLSSQFYSVDRGILSFKTLHNRAEVDLALGNYPLAKEGWLAAIEAAPTFTPSMIMLFESALQRGDLPSCRDMMARVSGVQGLSEDWCHMTEKYGEFAGGPEMADDLLFKATLSNGRAYAPFQALARRHLLRGENGKAIPLLDRLQQLGHPEGAFYLGQVMEMAGDQGAALFWFKRALELNPGHVDTISRIEALAGSPLAAGAER